MIYISIGNNCTIKYQIDKNKGTSQTLFFDWLITDMNSIISILSCVNIDKILNIDNIIRDPIIPYTEKNSIILIKSLTKCISIHDLGISYDDKDILDFINKYKRRYNNIINYINSNLKINFIRLGEITENEKKLFINTIKMINPNCNFTLININIEQDNNNIIKDDNLLQINLIDKNQDFELFEYLNWKQIFIDIDNNI